MDLEIAEKLKTTMASKPIVVIGAGVSGLACARRLKAKNFKVKVIEASDGVGGRVRSDQIDGFTLDRGFQVFLDMYPDVRRCLGRKGLDNLNLQQFLPGAQVYAEGKFNLVADPFRRPQDIFAGLTANIGSLVDKVSVGLMRTQATFQDLKQVFTAEEKSTYDYLKQDCGLSDAILERFFRPFYRGIYLSELEDQSSHMFNFVFKMFADGSATLPEKGIGAVSDELAATLKGSISFDSPVEKIEEGLVTLKSGETIEASKIIVATDGQTAGKLLPELVTPPTDRRSLCFYYAIDGPPPVEDPILFLNGEKITDQEPVNNVCFPSSVVKSLAPPGKSLASVSVIDPKVSEEELEPYVKQHLGKWFGKGKVEGWKLLKSYKIKGAQPGQTIPNNWEKKLQVAHGIYVCGDHMDTPTLNGAIRSGVRVADMIAEQRGRARAEALESALSTRAA